MFEPFKQLLLCLLAEQLAHREKKQFKNGYLIYLDHHFSEKHYCNTLETSFSFCNFYQK